ncbi:ALG6, ALG8 glycosyltransferase family-domain-containing protein [Naematelia encephala]|uniref:Alpha-1,3-glucosyltransferase n=1 Tax=Naematelia encephala TaxID=71784 RepID=A0A1Y2BBT6_9TREE|nr:ALG6, ALG8 glycosyltransferase family-domain-containing protein [Naematelia encephala]
MPRRSYAQHRASRVRRGSVAESETDLESLASYTTYSSNFTHPSSSGIPSPRLQHPQFQPLHQPQPLRLRTLSSTSHASNQHLEIPRTSRDSESSAARQARREARRKERERKSTLAGEKYDSPLRRWLRYMGSGWMSLGLGLVGVGVVKSAIGSGGFSGKDTPPMYGDFEAQRHWMEITINRPIEDWYTWRPDWWLLDYPPLSAYTSWLCGKIGNALDRSGTHFALNTSWGLSPPALVTFMRMSVLVLEVGVWWVAVGGWIIAEGKRGGRSWRSQVTGIMTVLLMPSLALVDNGHFQYNSVLLGLSLLSVLCFASNRDVLGCVAFSLALCFKQMGLYYAPAIGCYLLGKCIWLGGTRGLTHLIKLGTATLATFVIMFLPWLRPFPGALLQVLHRLFPFARGIFEDKVANLWCASNVVIKWRNLLSTPGMARLATATTLLALLPTVVILLRTSYTTSLQRSSPTNSNGSGPSIVEPADEISPPPTIRLLPTALFTSAMAFFLFSFQVHEKSILLPLMPLTIMMAMRGGKEARTDDDELWEMGVLVNNVAVFSMWPLLKRDQQSLQYVAVTFLWNYVIGYNPFTVSSSETLRYGSLLVYSIIALLHLPDILPHVIRPPARYPDLWVVLNVLLSFSVFSISYLWGLKKLLEGSWAIGGLGFESASSKAPSAGKVE